MPDDPKEAAPLGVTASVIHESTKAANVLLNSDPAKATRWMVFIAVCAFLVAACFGTIRVINSMETVVSMILRSKEDQADRDRQHFSGESEKVRAHCSKETELAAQREQQRTERMVAVFTDETAKARTSADARDRMIRDELIAIRVFMGKMKLPLPVDENDAAVRPIPKINSGGE